MFTLVDALSWPGSPERPNEDAFGCRGAWAWVIDGAMLPGISPIMDAPSDAAWFAAFASARLEALCGEAQDGAGLIRQVIEEARATFLAAAPPERHERHTWPAAALTLARASPGGLEFWTLADTIAYVLDADGASYTFGEAPGLRKAESAYAAELMRATGQGADEVRKTTLFREVMEGARKRQMEGDGPALFGLQPDAATRAELGAIALAGEAHVLLASDGFSALVELYEQADATTLVRRALDGGLEPLARELRRIEHDVDPEGARFARFKRSDDATALLLRATL